MTYALLAGNGSYQKISKTYPYRYRLYGLGVESDVPLPMPPSEAPTHSEPGLSIRLMTSSVEAWLASRGGVIAEVRCDCRIHRGSVITRLWEGNDGYWLWNESVATFHIQSGGEHVDVYPEFGADQQAIADAISSEVITFVLHRRGFPCLHASAIVTDEGAIAFLGPHGMGKSTLAASFLPAGFALLTDDIVPLQVQSDGVYTIPGPSTMKVWPETLENTLRFRGELPKVLEAFDKRLLTLGERFLHSRAPVRLRGLYVLDRFDPATTGAADVSIERLSKGEAILAVLTHTSPSAFLQQSEVASVLPIYARLVAQAPVSVLKYPAGFRYQDEVRGKILGDALSQ